MTLYETMFANKANMNEIISDMQNEIKIYLNSEVDLTNAEILQKDIEDFENGLKKLRIDLAYYYGARDVVNATICGIDVIVVEAYLEALKGHIKNEVA